MRALQLDSGRNCYSRPVLPFCLQEEFGYNAETQKLLCKNGETLLGAVNFFVSSINTLVTKTMEDTLMTVKQYEAARCGHQQGPGFWELAGMGGSLSFGVVRIEEGKESICGHRGGDQPVLPFPRLEYDAYRTDLEELSLGPRDAGTRGRLESAQATFQAHRDKYEKLRGDVAIKLKFLEENKVPTPPL